MIFPRGFYFTFDGLSNVCVLLGCVDQCFGASGLSLSLTRCRLAPTRRELGQQLDLWSSDNGWNKMSVIIGLLPDYRIHRIAGCAGDGNAGNAFPTTDFKGKPLVSDPDMHHGTCVTHVPRCMSWSLTRGGGENVPGIPGACVTRNFAYLARGPCIN